MAIEMSMCKICMVIKHHRKYPVKLDAGYLEQNGICHWGKIEIDYCCQECREKVYNAVMHTIGDIRNDPERGKSEIPTNIPPSPEPDTPAPEPRELGESEVPV